MHVLYMYINSCNISFIEYYTMTPEIGEYIAAGIQTMLAIFVIIVLHVTLFKNEDRDDE